jgi:lipopolysaccharide/colanic/teichoic acid biosynthesis glycosyltransferase
MIMQTDSALHPSWDPVHTRSVWGLDAAQLHQHFWAAHGVQVVRNGEPPSIDRAAALYLLVDPALLVLFDAEQTFKRTNWSSCKVAYVRLHDAAARQFGEHVVTDEDGQFVKFQRHYEGGPHSRIARVLVTPDPIIAAIWQMASEPALAGKAIQQVIDRDRRDVVSAAGKLYDLAPADEQDFILDMMQFWDDPHRTIENARQVVPQVWSDSPIDPSIRLVGPVWVGAGRALEPNSVVIGPVVLWDDPDARPEAQPPKIQRTGDMPGLSLTSSEHAPAFSRRYRVTKRIFDIIVSTIAIVISLPLYPIILLAIYLEDGRPLFFVHRRETRGGRKFGCIKFRSMRKDAEKIKRELIKQNSIDGPQFYMKKDPRLTRVGAFLRKRQLDELPQFINVLLGHMSVVGPRPSPYTENQFCPPWREARLSVRPGITGLWQVKRTRHADSDFQEWIKYDLEYLRRASLMFDMKIILQTGLMFIGRFRGKGQH